MTSKNVKLACERENLVATCVGDRLCRLSSRDCTVTSFTSNCYLPMTELSQNLCGVKLPMGCQKLHHIFAYVYNWKSGAAMGVTTKSAVFFPNELYVDGNMYWNKYALCAKKKVEIVFPQS